MKYVLLFAFIVLLSRIDFFINLVERGLGKYKSVTESAENKKLPLQVEDGGSTIPFGSDPTLKQSQREKFFAVLGAFSASPDEELRLKVMEEFKRQPKLFSEAADLQLERQIFAMRDLLELGTPSLVNLLVDLDQALVGNNQDMIRRFFSILLDAKPELFLKAYPATKDSNCSAAKILTDVVDDDVKILTFKTREETIKAYLAKDAVPVANKALAEACLMVVGLELAKLTTPPEPAAPVITPSEPLQPSEPPAPTP